jgi:small subunit ribosomal protein S20
MQIAIAHFAKYVLIYPLSFVKEVTALPNNRAAKKRVLIAERNHIYNRFWKTRCKNAVRKVLEAVEQKDPELAAKRYDLAQGVLDKAVVKGVVHRNTAARRKAVMSARVKSLTGEKA